MSDPPTRGIRGGPLSDRSDELDRRRSHLALGSKTVARAAAQFEFATLILITGYVASLLFSSLIVSPRREGIEAARVLRPLI
jgi:hypothetical protein